VCRQNFLLLPRVEAVPTKFAELAEVEKNVAARWAKIVPARTKVFAKCAALFQQLPVTIRTSHVSS